MAIARLVGRGRRRGVFMVSSLVAGVHAPDGTDTSTDSGRNAERGMQPQISQIRSFPAPMSAFFGPCFVKWRGYLMQTRTFIDLYQYPICGVNALTTPVAKNRFRWVKTPRKIYLKMNKI
jgi:hypothetical protein